MTPELEAYRRNPVHSQDEINMLRNGGVWRARAVPRPPELPLPDVWLDEPVQIYEFKARHVRNVRYEIYSVTTGEVVGWIN